MTQISVGWQLDRHGLSQLARGHGRRAVTGARSSTYRERQTKERRAGNQAKRGRISSSPSEESPNTQTTETKILSPRGALLFFLYTSKKQHAHTPSPGEEDAGGKQQGHPVSKWSEPAGVRVSSLGICRPTSQCVTRWDRGRKPPNPSGRGR